MWVSGSHKQQSAEPDIYFHSYLHLFTLLFNKDFSSLVKTNYYYLYWEINLSELGRGGDLFNNIPESRDSILRIVPINAYCRLI